MPCFHVIRHIQQEKDYYSTINYIIFFVSVTLFNSSQYTTFLSSDMAFHSFDNLEDSATNEIATDKSSSLFLTTVFLLFFLHTMTEKQVI